MGREARKIAVMAAASARSARQNVAHGVSRGKGEEKHLACEAGERGWSSPPLLFRISYARDAGYVNALNKSHGLRRGLRSFARYAG
jgi:hypothetical protein